MKISRKRLESIVREEFIKHVQRLQEAPTASVEDAESDNADKEKAPETKKDDGGEKKAKGAEEPAPKPADKADNTKPEEQEPKDTPGEEDHEADDLQQGHDDSEEEEDADEVTGGEIAKEIQGKTVQSITMDPKSKIMPGAQEIVVTFDQIPDPLRILIGKSGTVKFYFRGIHNEL